MVDYGKIKSYKRKDKINILDILVDRATQPIYSKQFHKNQYQPATNTIFFNDTQGATFRKNIKTPFTPKNQGFNTPLALFAHEIIHCYHELYDEDNYQDRRQNRQTKGKKMLDSGVDLSYPNKQEELVVLLTNQIAKNLGEDVRTNYGRSYYNIDNVLSIKKKEIVAS